MGNENSGLDSKMDGDKFYCFEVTKILPGDILLTASPSGKNSKVIRKFTQSDFSHAAICTEPGIFVEAVGPGVRRVNLGRMAVRDLANAKLLRLKNEVPNYQTIAETAADKAEAYLTRGYWLDGAIKSILNTKKTIHTTEFFCSHLVAHAFREAGFELVPNRTPEQVTPGAISESTSLRDITDEAVYAQTPVTWMRWEFLEDSEEASPHFVEVQVMQRIHRRMAKVFESHGLSAPGDFYEALTSLAKTQDKNTARAIDREFAASLESEGYLSLIEEDRFPTIKHALSVDKQIELGLAKKDFTDHDIDNLLQFYKTFQNTLPEQLNRRESDAALWEQLFGQTQFATFKHLCFVAETMRRRQQQIAVAIENAIKLLQSHRNHAS
jgi:uncharacterized protein YycO